MVILSIYLYILHKLPFRVLLADSLTLNKSVPPRGDGLGQHMSPAHSAKNSNKSQSEYATSASNHQNKDGDREGRTGPDLDPIRPGLARLTQNRKKGPVNEEEKENEELREFPGPLVRGETNKMDVLQFCKRKAKFYTDLTELNDRKSAELIWKLLELLIEGDGTVELTIIIDLLLLGHEPTTMDYQRNGIRIPQEANDDGSQKQGMSQETKPMLTKGKSVEEVMNILKYGQKEDVLDLAINSNEWNHAIFLAMNMGMQTYSRVLTRFANEAMMMNDPLQTLYQLMSGCEPDAVTCVTEERWGDWRPHLAMILSNQSETPELHRKIITTLGDTLASKGFLHASDFCYLMSQTSVVSYKDKKFLIGSDHRLPLEKFATNEAIQCTETFKYALSLSSTSVNLSNLQNQPQPESANHQPVNQQRQMQAWDNNQQAQYDPTFGSVTPISWLEEMTKWSKSVCQICWKGGSATGFRVGRSYIMTARHVIDEMEKAYQIEYQPDQYQPDLVYIGGKVLTNRDVYAVFDKIDDRYQPQERSKFYFKDLIKFDDRDTDSVVLELLTNNSTQMPPPFVLFGFLADNMSFRLVGHVVGKRKACHDVRRKETVTDTWIQKVRAKCTEIGLRFESNLVAMLRNPNRFLFHSVFTYGASGSPGFYIVEGKEGIQISIVTMLLCGYPDGYNKKKELPPDFRIEQGANMKSIKKKMKEKNRYLHDEIFGLV